MSLPSYQINIISCTTGLVVKIYDTPAIYSLRYSRKLNDIGVVAIALPSNDDNSTVFAIDNFIEIYRTSPITGDLILEETYLIRSLRRFRENNEERLVVGGVSLNHLLTRRIVDPDDDPTSTDGYSTKSGAADLVIRAYVREQAADLASAARQTPGLTVGLVSSIGLPVSKNARYVNLFTVVNGLSSQGGVDFIIERQTGAAMLMSIGPIGTNKSRSTNYPFSAWVGINPHRSNLSDPTLTIDRTDEKNYVYALGQGQGIDRRVVNATIADSVLSPFNRCEFVKDARNVPQTDITGLQSAAYSALADERVVTQFDFKPTGNEAGNVYRRNWDIGDTITAQWDDFEQDLRITGVEINLRDRDEEITVTVGNQYDASSN